MALATTNSAIGWGSRLRERLRLGGPLFLIGLTVAVAAISIATMTWGAVVRVDGLAAASQQQILERALTESIERITYDQEAVAIWDDAIANIRTAFNEKWVENNLGAWITKYFKHDQATVLDNRNNIIYVYSTDGRPASESATRSNQVDRLVAELREKIASGALDAFERGDGKVPFASDRIIWLGRPAVVSVMPIVSDTGDVMQERGSEYLLVSYRYLDGSFVRYQSEHNQLLGARFSFANAPSRRACLPSRQQQRSGVGIFDLDTGPTR